MTTVRPGHRFSIKKRIVAPIGVTTTVVACLAVGLPAAQATSGGDERGTDAVFGTWARSHDTDPQTDPNRPADPDGQDGQDNLANVTQIGERHEVWVPGTSNPESSGWRTSPPAGAGWAQVEERVVVDSAAIPTTEDSWANPVWHVYAGNNNSDTPPALDDPRWNATGGQPHSKNHAFENQTPNVPFAADKANDRGSDWFLWTATLVPGNPGQEAVTHQEFRYERQVTTPGHTEYYWSVYQRTNTAGEPAADEPSEPNESSEPYEPNEPDAATGPNQPDEQDVRGAAPGPNESTQQNRPDALPRAVPISIDAGL